MLGLTACVLQASASAEFFADSGLCPLEAVKVKVQTSPGVSQSQLCLNLLKIPGAESAVGWQDGLRASWMASPSLRQRTGVAG